MRHIVFIALLCCFNAASAQNLWQFDQHSQRYQLDFNLLRQYLQQAPSYRPELAGASISLPLPDQQFIVVQAFADSILSADLQSQYPDNKSYRLYDAQRLFIGRLNLNQNTMQALINTEKGWLSITSDDNGADYQALYVAQQTRPDFACYSKDKAESDNSQQQSSARFALAAKRFGSQLTTYRLAVSATYDYEQAFGSANAAYNEIINGVSMINAIYERDAGVRFELVSSQNLIATSAGGLLSGDINDLLKNNSAWIAQKAPSLAYDIGHVLSAQNLGGLAVVAGACSSNKAGGASGLAGKALLQSAYFYINYVAHEIGHQLGANHTFNAINSGACDSDRGNRVASSAYEPGSGSTIMSYAGVCTDQDLQTGADGYFHGYSIEQIRNFVDSHSCGTRDNSGDNHPPTANAGKDYSIPANTPFVLTGSASDADNDINFLYDWEQKDLGSASSSAAQLQSDRGNGPIIRSRPPSTSPSRSIPALDKLINNQAFDKGEILPSTSRLLHFMLTVRSGDYGIDQDQMQVQVVGNAGPFSLNEIGSSYTGLSAVPMVWQVADTNLAPINCAFIDLFISTDQGQNFSPILTATANTGQAEIILPNTATSKARLKIQCSDNIFYNVTRQNFTISPNTAISSVFSIHGLNATQYEGSNPTFTFIIQRTGDLSNPATVDYHFEHISTDDADFAAPFVDGTASFSAGQSEYPLSVSVSSDTIQEASEQFQLVLSQPSTGNNIALAQATGTILDGNAPVNSAGHHHKKGALDSIWLMLLSVLWLWRARESVILRLIFYRHPAHAPLRHPAHEVSQDLY